MLTRTVFLSYWHLNGTAVRAIPRPMLIVWASSAVSCSGMMGLVHASLQLHVTGPSTHLQGKHPVPAAIFDHRTLFL